MIEVIPAIISKDFKELKQKLEVIAPYVKTVQIDALDGVFAPAKSWPYSGDRNIFDKIVRGESRLPECDKLDFEVHLMVQDPETVVNDWISLGAKRILVHVESTNNFQKIVDVFNARRAFSKNGKASTIELGAVLNADTPIDAILPYLEDISSVQFMGIRRIGFQGESFVPEVIDRVRDFHDAHPEVIISIDGGVGFENAHDLIEAGARRLVSGSLIFKSDDIQAAIEHLKNI